MAPNNNGNNYIASFFISFKCQLNYIQPENISLHFLLNHIQMNMLEKEIIT